VGAGQPSRTLATWPRWGAAEPPGPVTSAGMPGICCVQVVKEPGRNASSARPLGRGARVLPLGKAAGGCLLYETGLGAASHARLVSQNLLEHRLVLATTCIIEDGPLAEKMVEAVKFSLREAPAHSFAEVSTWCSRMLKLRPIASVRLFLRAGTLTHPEPFPALRSVRCGLARACLRSLAALASRSVAGLTDVFQLSIIRL
jgi:hypothetical protein